MKTTAISVLGTQKDAQASDNADRLSKYLAKFGLRYRTLEGAGAR